MLLQAAPALSCSAAAVVGAAPACVQRLAAVPQQRRRRRQALVCQSTKSGGDVGRLLRDALQQPAAGQNPSYVAAATFLRSLGIEQQAEVNRILDVAMNPNSLFARNNRKQPTNPHARKLDVEADMTPVAEFLQQTAGLSREQTAKAISAHPPLLCYSVPDRLAPFFVFLTSELGLSAAEAAAVVERRPSILGVEVDGLRRMVGFLQESGTTRQEVAELLATTL